MMLILDCPKCEEKNNCTKRCLNDRYQFSSSRYIYVIRLLNGLFVKDVSFNLDLNSDDIQLNVVSSVSQAQQFSSKDLAESCCAVLQDYGYQSIPMGFSL